MMEYLEHYYKNTNETVYSGQHESGLRVFVMPKKGFTKSYAIIGTRYGSVNTCFTAPGDDEMTVIPDGIAHYLEHKMFDREEGELPVFDRFAAHGADANAFTGFTMTAYLFSAASEVYENLDILLDYTMHPYFTEETVEKERGIIGQEIKMYDDDPDWNVYFNALRAMYKVCPVNRDIAGTTETIAEITAEKLYKCYNTFYHPSNMVLFVTGNVDAAAVGAAVDKAMEGIKNPGEIINHEKEEPKEVSAHEIIGKFDIGTPQFVIGYKLSPAEFSAEKGDVSYEAERNIVAEILFGTGSDLYHSLYDEGLINDSYGYSHESERIYAFTEISGKSSDPRAVYERVKAHVDKVKREGFTKKEFERAKRVLTGNAVSLIDRQESFANEFIRFAAKGSDLLSYPGALSDTTYEDAQKRLCEIDNEYSVLSAVYPKDGE